MHVSVCIHMYMHVHVARRARARMHTPRCCPCGSWPDSGVLALKGLGIERADSALWGLALLGDGFQSTVWDLDFSGWARVEAEAPMHET